MKVVASSTLPHIWIESRIIDVNNVKCNVELTLCRSGNCSSSIACRQTTPLDLKRDISLIQLRYSADLVLERHDTLDEGALLINH